MDWYSKKKMGTGTPAYSPSPYGGLGASNGSLSPYANQRSSIYTHSSGNGASANTPGLTTPGGTPGGMKYHPVLPPAGRSTTSSPSQGTPQITSGAMDRHSYYFSQLPLYCADWTYLGMEDKECVALSTYKEGFNNKLQIIHGSSYGSEYTRGNGNDPIIQDEISVDSASPTSSGQSQYQKYQGHQQRYYEDSVVEGFDFHSVAEATVDYPITNLQWDPSMRTSGEQIIAASSEVLRLYRVASDPYDQGDSRLLQTHILANNASGNSSASANTASAGKGLGGEDINTFPPVTSFDWNKTDPNIIITSSVDTTCTVWDLHRSHTLQKTSDETVDTATVMTQLIAHDSEVFDVKFIHNSSNIFASVGNDGSMRVFDLRSLEHSTIIYEPTLPLTPTPSSISSAGTSLGANAMNAKALLKLSTSNIDQHHLATIGINSNQVIIIDMRMPGLPVATLDGSLGGVNHAAINMIRWHPSSNYILTGGDDCQALVWDCNGLQQSKNSGDSGLIVDTPVLAYEEELEVNNVCWRQNLGDWMGVVSGKGFQAVQL